MTSTKLQLLEQSVAAATALHIQGTRWRGLLLFLTNSPSLRVTAAPRGGRQICLVGHPGAPGRAQILDKKDVQ